MKKIYIAARKKAVEAFCLPLDASYVDVASRLTKEPGQIIEFDISDKNLCASYIWNFMLNRERNAFR